MHFVRLTALIIPSATVFHLLHVEMRIQTASGSRRSSNASTLHLIAKQFPGMPAALWRLGTGTWPDAAIPLQGPPVPDDRYGVSAGGAPGEEDRARGKGLTQVVLSPVRAIIH